MNSRSVCIMLYMSRFLSVLLGGLLRRRLCVCACVRTNSRSLNPHAIWLNAAMSATSHIHRWTDGTVTQAAGCKLCKCIGTMSIIFSKGLRWGGETPPSDSLQLLYITSMWCPVHSRSYSAFKCFHTSSTSLNLKLSLFFDPRFQPIDAAWLVKGAIWKKFRLTCSKKFALQRWRNNSLTLRHLCIEDISLS